MSHTLADRTQSHDSNQRPETVVRASVVVDAPIEHVFEIFTADMASWWPAENHIADVPFAAAIIEPRAGGRWYEVGIDGTTCEWGVVLAWDPPRHVALSWHLDGDFRFDAAAARSSRIDVRFTPGRDGTTIVELEHSGLDRHGPSWRRLRGKVSGGWASILRRFAARVQGAIR